jgi:hypothetical protein
MAVFATLVAPPMSDGKKPAPMAAPVMPIVGSIDEPEGWILGGVVGFFGVGLGAMDGFGATGFFGTVGLGAPGALGRTAGLGGFMDGGLIGILVKDTKLFPQDRI